MTKIQQMRKALSPSALAALETLGASHPGHVVELHPGKASLLAEFRIHGVVGPKDGLTVLGSGLAAQLSEEYMDRMF